ncbi:MAG: hypothetical protein HUK24_04250 [Sphaerochaetaceae bacterium]|nr:hypothetical protein [Sphaerochaetaceae bacterium]
MKKGTLVLMANMAGENYCRKWMLDGAMNGGLGVAAGSLPRHLSLGMPYYVKDFDAYMEFAEEFAKNFKPVTVKIKDMICAPVGPDFGGYFFVCETKDDVDGMRAMTRSALREKLGLEVPEKDGVTGKVNITLGFGKASYETYKAYTDSVDKSKFVGDEVTFDEFGVFYYDEETIGANNFICVKRIPLK